jgi:hypothetical protein
VTQRRVVTKHLALRRWSASSLHLYFHYIPILIFPFPFLYIKVEGIIISRCIFQRMKNFITYRIAATLQLLIFFFIAVLCFKPSGYYSGISSCCDCVAMIFLPLAMMVLLEFCCRFISCRVGLPSQQLKLRYFIVLQLCHYDIFALGHDSVVAISLSIYSLLCNASSPAATIQVMVIVQFCYFPTLLSFSYSFASCWLCISIHFHN